MSGIGGMKIQDLEDLPGELKSIKEDINDLQIAVYMLLQHITTEDALGPAKIKNIKKLIRVED